MGTIVPRQEPPFCPLPWEVRGNSECSWALSQGPFPQVICQEMSISFAKPTGWFLPYHYDR